jgi:hypothetical protein
VKRFLRTPLIWLAAALAAGAAVLVIAGGDADDGEHSTLEQSPATRHHPSIHQPSREGGEGRRPDRIREAVRRAVSESNAARLDPRQREVARVVRSYVAALSARDGDRACALFVPGALSGIDFPRQRQDCASSLAASIGYRDPRGFPVYERSRIARIRSVSIDGAEARVTATTVTRFADRREPSVEDDVVYLAREEGRWLIVKPSVALYRAIGAGDIPPQVLAPP